MPIPFLSLIRRAWSASSLEGAPSRPGRWFIVALVLGAAFLCWAPQSPAFVQQLALDHVRNQLAALFIAVQAAVAAGWATCRLLGWYAARPE